MRVKGSLLLAAAALAFGAGCAQIVGADFSDKTLADPAACSVNADCASFGETSICRKDTHRCVELLGEHCKELYGDYKTDGAVILGSIAPTSGIDETVGLPMLDAVKLAMDDFSDVTGLPPVKGDTRRRPLALLQCDDQSDVDIAVLAARHLAEDVGVPAILLGTTSGETIRIATEVTIAAGVLLMATSATSVNITALDDHDLVWRTAPPDTFQAEALTAYIPLVEQGVRDAVGLAPSDSIRVALLHKGDTYGKGLADALEQKLTINQAFATSTENQANYKRLNYGDPADPENHPPKLSESVDEVITFQPHITIILGTAEGVVDALGPIEKKWPAGAPFRTTFVFADGGLVTELWTLAAASPMEDNLRTRITGTIPGTENKLFDGFRSAFKSQFSDGASPEVFGAAGAFDATYLLAYSAAAVGVAPLTGADLAEGLGSLVPPGKSVDVGHLNISAAFKELTSGGKVDINGASGPLDFDLTTGEAPSDIQIWCLPKDANGLATSPINSGLYLDAKTLTLGGALGMGCL